MAIEKIFCNPALSIARLGKSRQSLDAFRWVANNNPHVTGETQIEPTWTLDIQPDGTVRPRLPTHIEFRDSEGIRPVSPFIEIWCQLEGDQNIQPLTLEVLEAEGLAIENISFVLEAANRKAARRTFNDELVYGTFPPLVIQGNDHRPKAVNAVSPRGVNFSDRMIPDSNPIKLGSFQVIRPTPNSMRAADWPETLRLDCVRVRFTPATGEFYGPPSADSSSGVNIGNNILNESAGWYNAQVYPVLASPADTFAGAENRMGNNLGLSLGIIDDTCDIRLTVNLSLAQPTAQPLTAFANIFSGPPDYAPDRRPFISLSDSLIDTEGDNALRDAQLTREELDSWVEDLFERAFEHVSLMNVDVWRNWLSDTLPQNARRSTPITNDQTPEPGRPMGGLDALRDEAIALNSPSAQVPLPITERARERHRYISDIATLKNLVQRDPERLLALVRPPFQEAQQGFTMQMPPFMRGSNARPLTLTVAQYNLLMSWVDLVVDEDPVTPSELAAAANITETAARDISERADSRRTDILNRDNQEPM